MKRQLEIYYGSYVSVVVGRLLEQLAQATSGDQKMAETEEGAKNLT